MDELTVDKLAEVLKESNRPLLSQVLRTLGPDRTSTVLLETLQCEAAGGMRTTDGTRRRTPGGTFFQLVRQQASPHERRRLFPRPAPQHSQGQPQAPRALTWEEANALVQTLETEPPGEARTMKLTLIGRPGKVETRGQAVMFRMQGKPPGALPRGLPPMPAQPPMTWNVMVAPAVAAGEGQPGRTPGGSAHHRRLPSHAGQPARAAGAELCEHAAAAGPEAGQAAAD
jgi:hypothetical protein